MCKYWLAVLQRQRPFWCRGDKGNLGPARWKVAPPGQKINYNNTIISLNYWLICYQLGSRERHVVILNMFENFLFPCNFVLEVLNRQMALHNMFTREGCRDSPGGGKIYICLNLSSTLTYLVIWFSAVWTTRLWLPPLRSSSSITSTLISVSGNRSPFWIFLTK